MTLFLAFALFLQAIVMTLDEFYFHRKRGLGLWEVIGHPLDTLTVLLPFFWVSFMTPTDLSRIGYIALAAFSCLFVTKDEWVHAKFCEPMEQWTHALLFVLHPVVLGGLYWVWWQSPSENAVNFVSWQSLVNFQILALSVFLMYQLTYWPWRFGKNRNLSGKGI